MVLEKTLTWPPYFSDLNLIENLWRLLKEEMHRIDSSIRLASGNDATRKRIEEMLEAAWRNLKEEHFEALIESMPRRMAAVIEADE
jgi:transposase